MYYIIATILWKFSLMKYISTVIPRPKCVSFTGHGILLFQLPTKLAVKLVS